MAKAKKKAARTALKKDARAGVKKALGTKSARGKAAPRRSVTPKGRWTAPGAKERAREAREATRTPKQEPLIKGLRIRALDNICGRISDTRAAIAKLQGEEADFERTAHDLMKKHDQMTWQHAGVVLARIPGDEKLRVTTVRSRGPAPAAEEETENQVDEAQESQDRPDPQLQQAADELGASIEDAEGSLTH